MEIKKTIDEKPQDKFSDSQVITIDYKEKIKFNKTNNKKRKADKNKCLKNKPNNIIDINNLSKYYIFEGSAIRVLTKLNLSIKRGEFVVMFGKSGSGKTTLLNLMSGLDRPTEGNLVVCDANLPYLSDTQLTKFRREKLAFIFQSYNLLTNLTGYDNVETGSYLQKDKSKKIDIRKSFEDFDLIDVIDKYPSQMSGGQQQRVSILRALAKNSEIIFADEPTGALDEKTSKIVLKLLKTINQELGKTIIMVSHDPKVVKYATRVIKLSKSKIISDEKIINGNVVKKIFYENKKPFKFDNEIKNDSNISENIYEEWIRKD